MFRLSLYYRRLKTSTSGSVLHCAYRSFVTEATWKTNNGIDLAPSVNISGNTEYAFCKLSFYKKKPTDLSKVTLHLKETCQLKENRSLHVSSVSLILPEKILINLNCFSPGALYPSLNGAR